MIQTSGAIGSYPAPLNLLSDDELSTLDPYVDTVRFDANTCIFRAGEDGDACYIIDDGVVRIEMNRKGDGSHSEVDSDDTLGYIEPGQMLGELSLLDRLPRSASAFAFTDVCSRRISVDAVERLNRLHPRVACALYAALGRGAAMKLRQTNVRLAQALTHDEPDPEVDVMIARARAAQEEIASWDEDRIDGLLCSMANAIADLAEELAIETVQETGIGNVPSKIVKNRIASVGAYRALVGRRGQGVLKEDEQSGVTDIASPVGVVFGLGPATNPVTTFIFKALICVKGRNALILSPNRSCQNVSAHVEDLLKAALRDHGAPIDLIQCVRSRTSRKKTTQFMSHPGVGLILATGGASMVKAAYSSGRPAIGVGPGNTPVLICEDADLPRVVGSILLSKTFDNGLPCGAEHNLVALEAIVPALVAEFEKQGAAVLSSEETARFNESVIDPAKDRFHHEIVGQAADSIAAQAGIQRDYPIRLIIVPTKSVDANNPYAREKMAPILSLFTAACVEEGIDICHGILLIDGCGHTAAIHSNDPDLVRRFGERMPASRILVNSPCVHGIIGVTTGLELSSTLGCGTFGGTSTTDNVTYRHVLNIKRLARYNPVVAAFWQPLL